MGRPAAFLDRDGTLNRRIGYVTSPDELELLPGAATAVMRLNRAGVLAIVITNQSAIARGLCDLPTLQRIHDRLHALLAAEGARLDAIYYCPHHPDLGAPPFRARCRCRKPLPGMIEAAAEEHAIDLPRSALFGDTDDDLAAARAAGVDGFLVGSDGVALDGAVDRGLAARAAVTGRSRR